MKAGYTTTEFWLTILTNVMTIAPMVAGVLPPKTGAVVLALANGMYAVLRTLAKQPDITTLVQQHFPELPQPPEGMAR